MLLTATMTAESTKERGSESVLLFLRFVAQSLPGRLCGCFVLVRFCKNQGISARPLVPIQREFVGYVQRGI